MWNNNNDQESDILLKLPEASPVSDERWKFAACVTARQRNFYRKPQAANRPRHWHRQPPLWISSLDEFYQKYESRPKCHRQAHANESSDNISNILNYRQCRLRHHSHRRRRKARLLLMICRNHRASFVRARWKSRWFWRTRPTEPNGKISWRRTRRLSVDGKKSL